MPLKRVLKYAFPQSGELDRLRLELPLGTRVLHFAFQRNVATFWALVPDREEKVARSFVVFGTGHPIPETSSMLEYLGSALGYDDGLVLHLFEEHNP